MKMFCNPDDERSCLCCGQPHKKGRPIKNVADAREAIEALEELGYSKEEMLGPYRPHIDWQAPGLAAFVRKSLS